jgi:hypothetical protein
MKKIFLAISLLLSVAGLNSQTNQWLNILSVDNRTANTCGHASIDIFANLDQVALGSNPAADNQPSFASFWVHILDCEDNLIFSFIMHPMLTNVAPSFNFTHLKWGYNLMIPLSQSETIKLLQNDNKYKVVVELTDYDMLQDDPNWDWSGGASSPAINLSAGTFGWTPGNNMDPNSYFGGSMRYSRAEHSLLGAFSGLSGSGSGTLQGISSLGALMHPSAPGSCALTMKYAFNLIAFPTTPGASLTYDISLYETSSSIPVYTTTRSVSMPTTPGSINDNLFPAGLKSNTNYDVVISNLRFMLGPAPLPEAYCYYFSLAAPCKCVNSLANMNYEAGPTTSCYKFTFSSVMSPCDPSATPPSIPELVNNAGSSFPFPNANQLSYYVKVNTTTVLSPTTTGMGSSAPLKAAICANNTSVAQNMTIFFPQVQSTPVPNPPGATTYKLELYEEGSTSLLATENVGTAPRIAPITITKNVFSIFGSYFTNNANKNKMYRVKLVAYFLNCPVHCDKVVGEFKLAIRYQESLGTSPDLLFGFSQLWTQNNNYATSPSNYTTQFQTFFNEETGIYKLMLHSPAVTSLGVNEFGNIYGTVFHPTNPTLNFNIAPKFIGDQNTQELTSLTSSTSQNFIQYFIANNAALKNRNVKFQVKYYSSCPEPNGLTYTGDMKVNWRDYARANCTVDLTLSSNTSTGQGASLMTTSNSTFNRNLAGTGLNTIVQATNPATPSGLGSQTGNFRLILTNLSTNQELNSLGLQIFEDKCLVQTGGNCTQYSGEQCIYNCDPNGIYYSELLNFQRQGIAGPSPNVLTTANQTLYFPINNPNKQFKVAVNDDFFPGYKSFNFFGSNFGNCLFKPTLPCNYFSNLGTGTGNINRHNKYKVRIHRNPAVTPKHNFAWATGVNFKDYYFRLQDASGFNTKMAGASADLEPLEANRLDLWAHGKALSYRMMLTDKSQFGLVVYDLMGREVYQQASQEYKEGMLESKLELPHLNSGLYIVRATLNGQEISQTLRLD